eukprot:286115_1
MTLFGITVDKWATGSTTNITTLCVQSICLWISITTLLSSLYHLFGNTNKIKSYWKFASLQLSQMFMTLFSCLYMFIHGWNYVFLYFHSNPLNCSIWFALIMIMLACTRILLFYFLMLRSSLAFESSLCNFNIPLKISVLLIVLVTTTTIATIYVLLIDFVSFHPYADKGYCWRIQGNRAVMASALFHATHCIASAAALVIFYLKSKAVNNFIAILRKDNKLNAKLMELDREFKRHIQLGMITIIGTIIIFFVQDVTSVTLGMIFALDQTVNNVLTFIILKENTKYYKCLCCKVKSIIEPPTIITTIELQRNKCDIIVNSSSGTDDTTTVSNENALEPSSYNIYTDDKSKKEHNSLPLFNIHNRFIENAKLIYTQLISIGYNDLIAQRISEFAATRFMNCIMCEESIFPCIECVSDYFILYGSFANYDKNNKLRFFLNFELEDG